MRVLYLGLWLGTDFFLFLNLFPFFMFLTVLQFYKLYIAIINHKQVLCLARKNDSLMILQYSYILIIIFIIKGRWCKKEKTGDGHGQHIMASQSHHLQTPISFLFFFPSFCVTLICLFFPTCGSGDAAAPRPKVQPLEVSHSSVLVVSNLDCRLKKNYHLHVVTLSATAVQCSAKWSQIAVGWQDCPGSSTILSTTWAAPLFAFYYPVVVVGEGEKMGPWMLVMRKAAFPFRLLSSEPSDATSDLLVWPCTPTEEWLFSRNKPI